MPSEGEYAWQQDLVYVAGSWRSMDLVYHAHLVIFNDGLTNKDCMDRIELAKEIERARKSCLS